MSGLFLGLKTQNPVVGITSTNPGTANAMADAQKTAIEQQSKWSNLPPTVVHEMPWHKATPGLKNVK